MTQNPKRPLGGHGKWAPKLTFEDRCYYYLQAKLGLGVMELSKMAGMDRSSMKRLIDDKYDAYADVKLKYKEIGHKEFSARYGQGPAGA